MIILALLHACPAYLPASRSVARPALLPRARLARCCDGPEPGDEPVEVILPEVIEATEAADAAASALSAALWPAIVGWLGARTGLAGPPAAARTAGCDTCQLESPPGAATFFGS